MMRLGVRRWMGHSRIVAGRAASTSGGGRGKSSDLERESSEVVSATGSGWMTASAWASLGSEFRGVSEEKFLRPIPESFLTPRATTDIVAAEELLQDMVLENEKRYEGIDVRDPSSMAIYDGERPRWMTLGNQVRAVSEFISGHLCHHISLPEWKELFDLKYAEMDLTYWLYVLHVHMVSRRATSIPIEKFNRRREVLEEVLLTMFESWASTSEDIMGRPPLTKIRFYIKDMYYVTAVNFEEALLHDGPGADLMLMGFLMKFCPLPRPEDVPMYTYYTLVHYIRFHTALFDRITDESIAKGNFNFLPPNDPAIFEPYNAVKFDEVIRSWTTSEEGDAENGNNVDDEHKPDSAATAGH